MTPGQQAVQAAHALADFAVHNPREFAEWHKSNFLVFLTVADEPSLWRLLGNLRARGVVATEFLAPDLGNALTAVCAEPNQEVRKLTSGLPLLLKQHGPVVPTGRTPDSRSGCCGFEPCQGHQKHHTLRMSA